MNKILQFIKQLLFKQKLASFDIEPTNPSSEPDFDWQYLVTPGHTIFARINHLSFVGSRLLLLLLASLALLYFGIDSASKLLDKLDRFESVANTRPIIDTSEIIHGSRQFKVASDSKPTAASELKSFITDNLASLTKSNKLSIPCNKSTRIAGRWADRKGSLEYPMCNAHASSSDKPARIYTYAIVQTEGQYRNWIGIFYKDKVWKYKNLGLKEFYQVPGYDNFDSSLIVNSLRADFSDLRIDNQSAKHDISKNVMEYDYD